MAKNKKLQSLSNEDLQGASGGNKVPFSKRDSNHLVIPARDQNWLQDRQEVFGTAAILFEPGRTIAEDRYTDLTNGAVLAQGDAEDLVSRRRVKQAKDGLCF
jgi:hypothetical protein